MRMGNGKGRSPQIHPCGEGRCQISPCLWLLKSRRSKSRSLAAGTGTAAAFSIAARSTGDVSGDGSCEYCHRQLWEKCYFWL